MIGEVVPAVRTLVPGLLTSSRASLVAVRNSRVKFLVFERDPSRPVCVVEFGDPMRLRTRHRVLSELHRLLPEQVPRSLCCEAWHRDVAVHVQEGLAGTPWFRLADGLTAPSAWRALLRSSLAAMAALHDAVRQVARWTGRVNIGRALDEQVRLLHASAAPLPAQVLRRLDEVCAAAPRGVVWSVWQHGDFSLNNLLVRSRSVAVIDFDEFGCTSMPLHDAFGLALSFPLSQAGRCPLTVVECVDTCLAAGAAEAPAGEPALGALALHHLLWRYNRSACLPSRARLCATLRDAIAHVALAGGDWRPALAAAFGHSSPAGVRHG